MIISDFFKKCYHQGFPPNVYFWRDKLGNEVDCLLEEGSRLIPIEIKSSATVQSEMFGTLEKWCEWAGVAPGSGKIIYSGKEDQARKQGSILSWKSL